MAKMTLAEGQKRWEDRHSRIMALQPTTFRGAMRQVLRVDKQWLDRQVYMAPGKGKRSGALRRSERLEFRGSKLAQIVNDAKGAGKRAAGGHVEAGDVYAWYVAEGTKAFVLPKRDKPYVWHGAKMTGKKLKSGKLSLQMGKGWNFSRGPLRIPEKKARRWRDKAVVFARKIIPEMLRGITRDVMNANTDEVQIQLDMISGRKR